MKEYLDNDNKNWQWPNEENSQKYVQVKIFDYLTHLNQNDIDNLPQEKQKFIMEHFYQLANIDDDLVKSSQMLIDLPERLKLSLIHN